MKIAILTLDFKINNAEAKVKKEDLVYAMVTSSGSFAGEFVKALQADTPLVPSTQTSKDSPTAICPLGNSN
jgi:hypothetical protein